MQFAYKSLSCFKSAALLTHQIQDVVLCIFHLLKFSRIKNIYGLLDEHNECIQIRLRKAPFLKVNLKSLSPRATVRFVTIYLYGNIF